MPKEYLECGKIVTTHGLKGEVKVQPWCDGPEFLQEFRTFYLDKDGENSIKATAVRATGNMGIIKFDGIDTIEQAVTVRGKVLFIKRSEAKLADGDYFVQDLIGMTVRDSENNDCVYGEITDVTETGANDVYHITKDAKIYLIPAIKKVVIAVDLDTNTMLIKPIMGLFDDGDEN